MTQAQIERISGWNNWNPNTPPPPGTIISDQVNPNDQGIPAIYHLIPAGQFTVRENVVGAAMNYIGNKLADAVLAVVIGVLIVIAGFCKLLLMFAGWTLDQTLNAGLYNFTSNQMITEGWVIVRDVCNLFFLLALLFIAFCTILKIEKYHARKTLLMLIIMALLINFSKPIAIFIFDGSQLLMNFFLSKMGPEPSTKFVGQIAVLIYDKLMNELVQQPSSIQVALYYLFVVVFLFMFAVAMFVTAIFLIIRIIAVMLLIIVSPFAFFASAIPDFNKISSSWWDAMFKYCYYGPAAAFFLFLATKFALGNSLPKVSISGQGQVIQNIMQYLTVLVFLYASIIMANKFSLQFSKAITDRADRFMKWGLGATKTGGMWGAMSRKSGVTGAMSQKLQSSGWTRWMTKEGRKQGQEARERWIADKVLRTKQPKKDQKDTAAAQKDMRDSNYSEKDYQNELKSGNRIKRMAAAIELAKMGKLDIAEYQKALQDFKRNPAFQGFFENEVKKKNIQVVIEQEIRSTPGATTAAAKQAIYDKHLNDLKPAALGDQNMDAFAIKDPTTGAITGYKAEFKDWADRKLPGLHSGVKNEIAKKLDGSHLAEFQSSTRGWV